MNAKYRVRATMERKNFSDEADNQPYAAFKQPPFRIDEEGWGEFDMQISLFTSGKGGEHTIAHDLNFQSEQYENKHTIVRAILTS